MPMYVVAALFTIGLVLVVKGGDMFVDAAGWVSGATGISKVVIGATIVSLATTAPEHFVSLIASMKGYYDLSIGNAVGSLICNIGIAFALLSIFVPGKMGDRFLGVKGFLMIGSTAVLGVFCLNGAISIPEAVLLLLIFVLFTFVNIRYAKDGETPGSRTPVRGREIGINVFKFVGGAAAIVFGSNLIVDNGKIFATALGVSEAVIGLTLVAIGTSLPEIVTSIAAIAKKQNALSIGNIIGANTIDATLILATSSFVSGGKLAVAPETVRLDLPVALLFMAITVVPTAIGKRIYKWQGILLLCLYVPYLLYITLGGR